MIKDSSIEPCQICLRHHPGESCPTTMENLDSGAIEAAEFCHRYIAPPGFVSSYMAPGSVRRIPWTSFVEAVFEFRENPKDIIPIEKVELHLERFKNAYGADVWWKFSTYTGRLYLFQEPAK